MIILRQKLPISFPSPQIHFKNLLSSPNFTIPKTMLCSKQSTSVSSMASISPLFFIILFIAAYMPSSSSLRIPITHTLSTNHQAGAAVHHLLKSSADRSAARHRHRRSQVSLPLSPGSDYTLSFSLGSQTLSLYMDTGSDLVWFPCSPFECILCEGKTTSPPPPPLNVSSSSLLTCQSRACSAAHTSLPTSDLCAVANCPLDRIETSDCADFRCPSFYYAYGDGSLVANLHRDTLKMGPGPGNPFTLPNFTFGCAHSALAEPIGVAGFGRGFLSFPNQLANLSPQLGNQFSYCLVSHSFDSTRMGQPSPLILGRSSGREKKSRKMDAGSSSSSIDKIVYSYTPLLDNPKNPYFYSIGLESVSIGPTRIPAPESLKRVDLKGNGGVVVDSGTTFTMISTELYKAVTSELDKTLGRAFKRAADTEGRTGLSPCFYMDGPSSGSGNVPGLTFHFGGNSTVELPRENYFYEFVDGGDGGKKGRKVGCFMMMDGGDEADSGGGPGMTLGNYQQQGFEVVYDLENSRVGFARRACSDLWSEVGR